MNSAKRIVFFDGICGLCNASVDRLLRWDRNDRLMFSPLQGETAKEVLVPRGIDPAALESLVTFKNGVALQRSDAVLAILNELGGIFTIGAFSARLMPRFLREKLYNYVARHRYQWFSKKETCRIPSASEKTKFLS